MIYEKTEAHSTNVGFLLHFQFARTPALYTQLLYWLNTIPSASQLILVRNFAFETYKMKAKPV